MKGLNLKTFLKEAVGNSRAKTEHLDGSFYYPDYGIGAIMDALVEQCRHENIHKKSKITKVWHENNRITAIEANGEQRRSIDFLVSTIPMNHFLTILNPRPPEEILEAVRFLKYRHLRLVALFIDADSITRAATVYFPDAQYPFTRLYEPKNRSLTMAPKGKTSLVLEIPCQEEDEIWGKSAEALVQELGETFVRIGWIKKEQLIGGTVKNMMYAYPVLEKDFEPRAKRIVDYLSRFDNLALAGRCGMFRYTHLHDMMRRGKDIVERIQIPETVS